MFVDMRRMPEIEARAMARRLMFSVDKFFSDPVNEAAYQEYRMNREKEKSNEIRSDG